MLNSSSVRMSRAGDPATCPTLTPVQISVGIDYGPMGFSQSVQTVSWVLLDTGDFGDTSGADSCSAVVASGSGGASGGAVRIRPAAAPGSSSDTSYPGALHPCAWFCARLYSHPLCVRLP